MTPRLGRWLVPSLPLIGAVALLASGGGAIDYHAALALAPLHALAAARLGLQQQPGLDRRRWSLLALAPLALLLAAAPWRPSCEFWHGMGFWLLGPLMSALVGAGMGRLAALLTARGSGQRLILLALLVGSSLPGALAFLQGPQVFGYAPAVGWVAGALYEDGVALHWGYVAYRLVDLAIWLPLLATSLALERQQLPWSLASCRLVFRSQPGLAAALWLSPLALGVGLERAGPERWRVDAAAIEAALPVRVQLDQQQCGGVPGDHSPALLLHLPGGANSARRRELFIHDTCFRYRQLREWFAEAPPVQLYAWPDTRAKQRWMGAARVEIAKPWLGQAHLVLPELGASVLTHEMAHVFAARWNRGPLGIPLRYGVLPDALAIEGLAVAAEWPLRGGLSPHQWARAARRLNKAPPYVKLLSPQGFLAGNSDLAYTLAGSLVRWLRDTRGLAAVHTLYATGDWPLAAGASVEEFSRQWAAFIDDPLRHPLSDDDMERARARFEPPGLFERPCALALGRCRDRADRLLRTGRPRLAVAEWQGLSERLQQVLEGPEGPEVAWAHRAALASAGEPLEALAELQQWLTESAAAGRPINRLQRAAAESLMGDFAWHGAQLEQARRHWSAAAQLPVSEATLRTLEVKQALAAEPGAKEFLASQLLAGGSAQRPSAVFRRMANALPDHPLAGYLLARRALRLQTGESAVADLERWLPQLRQTWPWTAREAARLLALHKARTGDCTALQLPELRTEPQEIRFELEQRCGFGQPR